MSHSIALQRQRLKHWQYSWELSEGKNLYRTVLAFGLGVVP